MNNSVFYIPMNPFFCHDIHFSLGKSFDFMFDATISSNERPGSSSTRKSLSLSGFSWPYANEPKTLRDFAPCFLAIFMISALFVVSIGFIIGSIGLIC